jgi:hypothetical protein
MYRWIFALLATTLFACKEKKIDLSGQTPVKVHDFVAAFPVLPLPFVAADSNIYKIADSTDIGLTVFSQFIPDSVLSNLIDKENVVIRPVGRIEKSKETYLLASFTHHKKVQLITFVLDKDNKFLAAKELLNNYNEDGYYHYVSINKEPTFLIAQEKLSKDKQLLFTRIGWVYNTGSTFMVVLNDGNEDSRKNDLIIDPIDTLPKKNKLSGNYVQDKKNFISLRDGRDLNSYQFFIHFEKQEGTCTGELKGVLKMKSVTTAVYAESGDPCVINFEFDGNTIIVKEQGSCGNRRGMKCYFDDTFTKKKESKTGRKKSGHL